MTLTEQAEANKQNFTDFEIACKQRDKSAAYKATSKMPEALKPGEPPDINRVRVAAHCAASQLYGWEMTNV